MKRTNFKNFQKLEKYKAFSKKLKYYVLEPRWMPNGKTYYVQIYEQKATMYHARDG